MRTARQVHALPEAGSRMGTGAANKRGSSLETCMSARQPIKGLGTQLPARRCCCCAVAFENLRTQARLAPAAPAACRLASGTAHLVAWGPSLLTLTVLLGWVSE